MQKKIVISTLILLTSAVRALANTPDNSGVYIGAQLGKSDMNYGGTEYTKPNNTAESRKPGFRAYTGYDFSEFLAIELGYDYYGKPKIKNSNGNNQEVVQQGIDLSGKVSFPLYYHLGLYAKGGIAWVHRSELESRGDLFDEKKSDNKFIPLCGVGMTCDITPNWVTDISWTQTASNSDLPKNNFYAVGIAYKFR